MAMTEPHRHGVWSDLQSGRSACAGQRTNALEVSGSPADLADLPTDCAGRLQPPVSIHFAFFSDGQGFTLARHLREIAGYRDKLLACGHLIPDQADYLRRCGFTHVEIDRITETQWRRSLALSPPPMQRVLSTPASRSATP